MRRHKYKAEKVSFAGLWFHSKLEAAVYALLLLREKAGELKVIQLQKHVKFHTYKYGEIRMIPDFYVQDLKTGEEFFIEAKGMETREWLRKRKAWLIGGPGRMEIWKGSHTRPKLTEILIPKGEDNAA